MHDVKKTLALVTALALLPVVLASAKPKPVYLEGARRLVQVVQFAERRDIVEMESLYRNMLEQGIKDADIKDGSVAFGMIYCCGGKISVATVMAVWIPEGLDVELNDFVEIRVGKPRDRKKPGKWPGVATAMRVRQRADALRRPCWWAPPQEGLWMRVLYCDWMKAEGWKHQGGLHAAWYKPAAR